MANEISIKCPVCGKEWTEDLDQHQAVRTIFRADDDDPAQAPRLEEYSFQCPRCGENIVVKVDPEG